MTLIFQSLNENYKGTSTGSLSLSIYSELCWPEARFPETLACQSNRAFSTHGFPAGARISDRPIVASSRSKHLSAPARQLSDRAIFARATEEFKKVLALDPNLVEAEANLGLAYQSLLDYDSAARYLAHALRERPNLPGLNVIVGMDYLKLGSPEKAIPYLQHALELDPSNPDAHDAMALYHLTQERLSGRSGGVP